MKIYQYPKDKPETDLCCFVCNIQGYHYWFEAIYSKESDTFTECDPDHYRHRTLAVTHWFEVPCIHLLKKG